LLDSITNSQRAFLGQTWFGQPSCAAKCILSLDGIADEWRGGSAGLILALLSEVWFLPATMANPVAFRPTAVTFWTTLIYLVVLTTLIYIHETVPRAPNRQDAYRGLNMTQAWLDLSFITQRFHPYNSHDNDKIRDYLLLRIAHILDGNEVDWVTDETGGVRASNLKCVYSKCSLYH
jgi:hypothetical protein